MSCSLWLRTEAARQRRRARQLCSLRTACAPPCGVVGGEALRLAPPGAGVLVDTLRELATRATRTTTSGMGSGQGAWARVAVRSVLEDHETAILEVERQVELLEKGVRDVDTFATAFFELEARVEEMEKRLRDTEPFVAVVVQLETRVEKMEQLEVQFVQLWGLAKLTELVVAELRTKLESRVTNLEQWSDTIATTLSRIASIFWSIVGDGCGAGRGRDTNTRQGCGGRFRRIQTVQLACLVAVVDVPVTMQLVLLQSKSYVFCAAFQFLDGVWDIQLCHRVRFHIGVLEQGCLRCCA